MKFVPFEILDVFEGHGGDVVVVGRRRRQRLAGQAEPSLALVLTVMTTQMLLKLFLINKRYYLSYKADAVAQVPKRWWVKVLFRFLKYLFN